MPIIVPPPYSAAVIDQNYILESPDPRPAQEEAANKIGVRITLNDSDLVEPPVVVGDLAKTCIAQACVYYRRYCGEAGVYCGFAYGVAPADAVSVRLNAFQIKARTSALLNDVLGKIGIRVGVGNAGIVHLKDLSQAATDPKGCADPIYIINDKPACPSDARHG